MNTHVFRSTSVEPQRPTSCQSHFIHQRPRRRSSASWILPLLALALGAMRLPAQINVTIPGTANIFGAGHASPPQPGGGGAGTLPIQVVVPNGASYVTFTGVAGAVTWCEHPLTSPPEGVTDYDWTDISSYGGISGIIAEDRAIFLTGVFLDNTEPVDPAPAILTFTTSGIGFATLAPVLRQTFFVGDGLTGTGSGTVQQFLVPSGATRLYLGIADANFFYGSPGHYGDNGGSFTATATFTLPPAPPSIALCTTSLDFGDTGIQATFQVWNSGGGTLNYTLSGWPSWVSSVTPATGSSTGTGNKTTHTVTIDRSILVPGPNTGQLTVTASGADDSPKTVQLSAMNRVISGRIYFKNRTGGTVGDSQRPKQPIWATLWRSQGKDAAGYHWSGPYSGDNGFVWTRSVDHSWVDDFPYQIKLQNEANGDYLIGFSVLGADLKVIPVTLTNGYAENVDAVLSYEDVRRWEWIYFTGKQIKYCFSDRVPDTADPGRADEEKEAIIRATQAWEKTGVVKFIRVATNDPTVNIIFSKTEEHLYNWKNEEVQARTDPLWLECRLHVQFELYDQRPPAVRWQVFDSLVCDGGSWNTALDAGGYHPPPSLSSVALHEVGHCLGLCSCEDFCGDTSPGQQWSIMDYFSVGKITWPGWSDVDALNNINKATKYVASCPVDVVLIDPNGLTTTRTNAGIPTSQYYETNYVSEVDGTTNHLAVVIVEDPIPGNYLVTVIPRPEAQTNDTFSLSVQSGNGEVPIAASLPLSAMPTTGFTVYAEPALAQFDHCVFTEPLDLGDVYVLNGTALPTSFSLLNSTNAPINEIRDLVMEIVGPDATGTLYTNVFSLTNSTLLCDTSATPPVYSAAFDTVTNSVKVDEQYSLAVKQYGAPIGTATLTVSTNRDSRVNIRDCGLTSDSRMSLRWGVFPGQVFLESSTNLTSWETAAGPLSTNRWTSSSPATEPSRFYRIRGVLPGP